jgi:hypothetical protein
MTRWSALLLCGLALAIGCGKSEKAAVPKKKDKPAKTAKKSRSRDGSGRWDDKGKSVFGPMIYDDHVQKLSSPDVQARLAACKGLAVMGPQAKDALPKLRKIAKSDKDANVKREARRAIKAIAG